MEKTNNYVAPFKIRVDKKDYYRVKYVTLEGALIEEWDFEVKSPEKDLETKEKAIKKYNQLIDDEEKIIKAELT